MSIGSSFATAVERVVAPVEGMHRAIAGGWFRRLDPPTRPVRVIHDAISTTVYASIRQGARLAGKVIDATVSTDRPGLPAAEAIVNGFWGDDLDTGEVAEFESMSIRDRFGQSIAFDADLTAAIPTAPRLVILIHGLADTERCWHGTKGTPGFLDAIDANPELTPLTVRYNTGLRVSTNGSLLADLLEALVFSLPNAPQSIALVGHSMGGLVAGNAILTAQAAKHTWVESVADLVTLGTPHRGAPLEKFANVAGRALRLTPATLPLAEFLDRRSVGIKDLRFGNVTERDSNGHDVSCVVDLATGPGSNIRHHFVGGVVTANPANPMGRLLGDLMVSPTSSSGPRHSSATNVAIHHGIHHRQLTRDPRVIDQVMGWLVEPTGTEVNLSPGS